MLETLRSNLVSNEEILKQIGDGDVGIWETLNTNFDFNELIQLAEQDQDKFTAIVQDGYQVKFITFKGLQRLLQLKFNKTVDEDYQLTNKGVTDLRLDGAQLSVLKQMLSKNWAVHETTAKNSLQWGRIVKVELV